MTLKDAIAEDVDLVLDLDEFAETVAIEGRAIKAQLDYSNCIGELPGYAEYSVALQTATLYAATADLPPARKRGDALMIGASDWTVESWEDQMGVSVVRLRRPL